MKYYSAGRNEIIVDGRHVRVERTGADYYYKGNDGKYYYGDLKNNGYLILAEAERKKELAKPKQNSAQNRNSGAFPVNTGAGSTIGGFLLGYFGANILLNHGMKILKVIGLLMASFFVVLAVWTVYNLISMNTPITLNADEHSLTVHVNHFLLDEENNIWATTLEGELTNKTSDIWRISSLAFWGKDSDGNYIRDEGGKILFRTDVYRLQPGQTAEFSTDQYRSQGEEEPSLTFEIADIKIDGRKYKLQDKDAIVILE